MTAQTKRTIAVIAGGMLGWLVIAAVAPLLGEVIFWLALANAVGLACWIGYKEARTWL